jgi:ribosomal protein S16
MLGATVPSDHVDIWIDELTEETIFLQRLEDLARLSRDAAVYSDSGVFQDNMVKQSSICRDLETIRQRRENRLTRIGQKSSELLVVVLAATPMERQAEVIGIFGEYIKAAETTQKEIDTNRHFFDAALMTVEGALRSVAEASSDSTVTYNSYGSTQPRPAAMYVSTCT